MKRKLLFTLFGALFASSTLVGCNHKTLMFKNVRSILPYFHYAEYNDFSLEHADSYNKYIEEHFGDRFAKYSDALTLLGGCSSVRNGNFYGRNLDYFYAETAEFMIHMLPDASKGRLESLGMAQHPYFIEEDILEYEKTGNYDEELNYLPNLTTDGINEKGVACSINVVAREDAGDISHTNPDKGYEEMMMMYGVRYVLNHATTAKDAVDLLKAKDIVMSDDLEQAGLDVPNVQMMIADKTETYIVVPFNQSLRVMSTKNISKPEGNILTNYYLKGDDDFITEDELKDSYDGDEEKTYYNGYNKNAMGVERFETLKKRYGTTNTYEGMMEALKSVRFSNAYTNPSEPNWPSEDADQTIINDNGEEGRFKKWSTGQDWEDEELPSYPDIYKVTIDTLENGKRDEAFENDVWITTHSTVIDLENKKIWVASQENYTMIQSFTF